MQQALLKCEIPRLELKSSRSFLTIKRCQRTKSKKVINRSRGHISATLVVKLLIAFIFPLVSGAYAENRNLDLGFWREINSVRTDRCT
jgi:hypothetical protein